MATWASRRRFIYGSAAVIVLAAAIGFPTYKALYKAPSCFDGIQNGDETGIDCGGSCTKLCSSSFLALPAPSWTRFEKIAPGAYNVAAYIVNPNPNAAASGVPYTFELIDRDGITLASHAGTFDIPAGRDTLVFDGPLKVPNQTPVRAIVDLGSSPGWQPASDTLRTLAVASTQYTETASSSALSVTLRNDGALQLPGMVVYAILEDASSTVLDFSKTLIDGIAPGSTALAPFTWPYGHDGRVVSIKVLPVPQ